MVQPSGGQLERTEPASDPANDGAGFIVRRPAAKNCNMRIELNRVELFRESTDGRE